MVSEKTKEILIFTDVGHMEFTNNTAIKHIYLFGSTFEVNSLDHAFIAVV